MAFINASAPHLRDTAMRLRTIQLSLDELGREARARIDDLGIRQSHLMGMIEGFRQSSIMAPETLSDIASFLDKVADQLEDLDSSLAQGLS